MIRQPRVAAIVAVVLVALSACGGDDDTQQADPAQSPEAVVRFKQMALDCVHREYPNKIAHVMNDDDDAQPPRVLHPVFYGCFDWHSSVHGHWLLARLTRLYPDNPLADDAREALDESFRKKAVAAEVRYLRNHRNFERPYGSAWLLQLTAELREWDDEDARRWLDILAPLEEAVVDQFESWLPKLAYPIRLGTHNQTAFGFALALDWARVAGNEPMELLLRKKILEFHERDVDCPLSYEPSGEDFLSPCLMEADLMRRVMSRERFQRWLGEFLPGIPLDGSTDWLVPGVVHDPTDGKLVHLDGVNLSRAWNLEAIASALPVDDERRLALLATARVHAESGLSAVSSEHYEGGHWLASFATYLISQRWAASPE
ncbi:MAG: DUF2891 domain-containing protein [Gammaproteobacteria bacterium]|nr:DUF2891 domain-containing protein [Gammaproteobacteria bacterium]